MQFRESMIEYRTHRNLALCQSSSVREKSVTNPKLKWKTNMKLQTWRQISMRTILKNYMGSSPLILRVTYPKWNLISGKPFDSILCTLCTKLWQPHKNWKRSLRNEEMSCEILEGEIFLYVYMWYPTLKTILILTHLTSQIGRSTPLKKAAGLNNDFLIAWKKILSNNNTSCLMYSTSSIHIKWD